MLRAFREHSNQTLHSKHLILLVLVFSKYFSQQQLLTSEIQEQRALREHSTSTLPSHHLLFAVCSFFADTFHTTDNNIGESGAESISRALQSNTHLKLLDISGV